MNIKLLIKSAIYFISLIFKKREYDVVFVYLNHFNRGEHGKNIFLEPFFKVCKKHNIEYKVFEDTDLKGAYDRYPRNNDAIPLDFVTFLRIILRKIFKNKYLNLKDYNNYYYREKKITLILKKIFLKNLNYNICINMAGDTIELFREISPNAKLCEYQHGLIGEGKHSVIYKGIPNLKIIKNDIILLVYGKGFLNLFQRLDNTKYYNNQTILPIGFYENRNKSEVKSKNHKRILFTLENVQDYTIEVLECYIKQVQDLLIENIDILEKLGYTIIWKNHPRFNPNYQITIQSSYIQKSTSADIVEDLKNVDLLITFSSTTAFDATLKSIPTIFINTDKKEFSSEKIYLKQYKYPLTNLVVNKYTDLALILEFLNNDTNYVNASKIVYEWAREYYQDFNEKEFLKLLGKV